MEFNSLLTYFSNFSNEYSVFPFDTSLIFYPFPPSIFYDAFSCYVPFTNLSFVENKVFNSLAGHVINIDSDVDTENVDVNGDQRNKKHPHLKSWGINQQQEFFSSVLEDTYMKNGDTVQSMRKTKSSESYTHSLSAVAVAVQPRRDQRVSYVGIAESLAALEQFKLF